MKWSHAEIVRLFSGMTLCDGVVVTTVAEDIKVEGEAFMNRRKNKIIPAYEIKVTIPFAGASDHPAADGCAGSVVFPYLGDENQDEDAEVKVEVSKDGKGGTGRDVILGAAKADLIAKCRTFVEKLCAGGPLLEDAPPTA